MCTVIVEILKFINVIVRLKILCILYYCELLSVLAFIALTLLVGQQEGHPA